MNDSQATPVDPAASKKSPLDVLEEILQDSKGKAQSSTPNDQAAASDDQVAVPVVDPEEEARKAAEIEAQKQADQQAIAIKQQEIENMKQSPQYQAAVEQKEEEVQEQTQQQDFMKGNEIRQLEHKKIEVTE